MNYGKHVVWTIKTPCHLHVNPAVCTTEIEILVISQCHISLSSKVGENLYKNHTDLHSFICIDSAALQQVNVERLIDGPQRRGVLLWETIRGEEI